MNSIAFLSGFLEKLARFTSTPSAERHAKKHSVSLGISKKEYLRIAKQLGKSKKGWAPMPNPKGSNPMYRHKKKGWKAVMTNDNKKVITIY